MTLAADGIYIVGPARVVGVREVKPNDELRSRFGYITIEISVFETIKPVAAPNVETSDSMLRFDAFAMLNDDGTITPRKGPERALIFLRIREDTGTVRLINSQSAIVPLPSGAVDVSKGESEPADDPYWTELATFKSFEEVVDHVKSTTPR